MSAENGLVVAELLQLLCFAAGSQEGIVVVVSGGGC